MQEPFTLAGVTLNVEQRASLANSLVLLRDSQNFASAELWGIIQGVQKDYYVAKCKGEDSLFDSKYFYSLDAVIWVQLPNITPQDREKAVNVRSKFTGDPAFELSETGDEGVMNEEKRLAAVVTEITNDVEVVPRGSYYKDATQKLRVNPSFDGVPKNELAQLSSYMHFRRGLDLDSKSMIERERLDESLDIFEDISQDQPKGVWSLQTYHGRPGYGPGSVAMLRSLLWPGYLSYHSVSTSASCHAQYGSIYTGFGLKNVDVGFMV